MTSSLHRPRQARSLPERLACSLVPTGAVAAALSLTLSVAACGETGQARFEIPIAAAGTTPETISVGDWDVTVTEARVAFGPVYLCASQNAGLDACAQAAAEHLGATSFDALSDTPSPMGTMRGVRGLTVLSGMWDYARSWRLSETAPRPLEGAVDDAHSAVLTITATRRDDGRARTYHFVLDIDGAGEPSGSTAVRTRLPEHRLSGSDRGLVVRFDPTTWASMLDYDALADLAEGADGVVEVPPDHLGANAIAIGMATTGLPSFDWETE